MDEIIENSRKTFSRPKAEVEKSITDWHEEGKVVAPTKSATSRPYTPDKQVPTQVAKHEPKPIDLRGRKEERPSQPSKPLVLAPLTPPISLKSVSEKKDNQRKPDAKHISDLRDALKAVVGEKPKVVVTSVPPPQPGPQPQIKKEPSPEELKKILDVS